MQNLNLCGLWCFSLEVCDYLKILGDRTYTFLPIISCKNLKSLKYIDAQQWIDVISFHIICVFYYIYLNVCMCVYDKRKGKGEKGEREKKRLIDEALWVWKFQPTLWHLMFLFLWQVLRFPDDVFLVGVLFVNHIVSDNDSPGPAWNALLSNTWQLMSGITSFWGFTVAWSDCVCLKTHSFVCCIWGVGMAERHPREDVHWTVEGKWLTLGTRAFV